MFSFKMLFGLHAVPSVFLAAMWKIYYKSCLWICSCQSLCMKTEIPSEQWPAEKRANEWAVGSMPIVCLISWGEWLSKINSF